MVGVVLSAGCHIGRQSVDVVLILVWICRLQFSQFTVQKKNILILPKTAAGVLPPVILTGICFLLLFLKSFLLVGKFCPIQGEHSRPSIGQNLPSGREESCTSSGSCRKIRFARFQPCRTRIISPAFSNSANAALTVRSLRLRSFAICRMV